MVVNKNTLENSSLFFPKRKLGNIDGKIKVVKDHWGHYASLPLAKTLLKENDWISPFMNIDGGGKASNLVKMARKGINVPPGFVIGYDAFDFYKKNKKLPNNLLNDVWKMCQQLGGNVALRSSGNVEDGETAGGFGVFETFLRESISREQLESDLIALMEASFSDEVLSYYNSHNISGDKIKMGIVVQQLVYQPDFSGTIFCGSNQEGMFVDYASQSYGTQVVDGGKTSGKIIYDHEGNVVKHKKFNAEHSPLSEQIVSEIHEKVSEIKKATGIDRVDVEFAIKDGVVYFLQARPLTSVLPDWRLEAFSEGSLCKFQDGEPSFCTVVKLNSFDDVSISLAKKKNEEIISNGKKPLFVVEHTATKTDVLMNASYGLVESGSAGSHGAGRAKELATRRDFGFPSFGGANLDLFVDGETVYVDSKKYEILSSDGNNILQPLMADISNPYDVVTSYVKKHQENYVFLEDCGQVEALTWLKRELDAAVPDYSQMLFSLLVKNLPSMTVSYVESGFDSYQSRRKLSKIIGTFFAIGGLIYEYALLGLNIDVDDALGYLGLDFDLTGVDKDFLASLAKEHGYNQEFLFPGIVPSPECSYSQEEIAKLMLEGTPIATTRSIAGVGSYRNDKERSHVSDFRTFLDLKLGEDECRYYPGIGIVHALIHQPSLIEVAYFKELEKSNSTLFQQFEELQRYIQGLSNKKEDYEGVGVLSGLMLPEDGFINEQDMIFCHNNELSLLKDFHSPGYELGALLSAIVSGEDRDILESLHDLFSQCKRLKTFNSPLHLPWGAEKIAQLSHGLVGLLKNKNGEYCMRYGISYKDESLEICEHVFNNGQRSYFLRKYAMPDFMGSVMYSDIIHPGSDRRNYIENHGFFHFALDLLLTD